MTTTFLPPRRGDVPRPGRPPTGIVLGDPPPRTVLVARADRLLPRGSGQVASAQMIARAATTVDHETMAAVGMAIHLVAEPAARGVDAEHHQVIAIATTQLRAALSEAEPLATIEALVTDPRRRATADGRDAAAYFGAEWDRVRDAAGDRATEACRGAETFGVDAVIKLAVVRGVNCQRAWWGTSAWNDAVASWAERTAPSDELIALLQETPEDVPLDVVEAILAGLERA